MLPAAGVLLVSAACGAGSNPVPGLDAQLAGFDFTHFHSNHPGGSSSPSPTGTGLGISVVGSDAAHPEISLFLSWDRDTGPGHYLGQAVLLRGAGIATYSSAPRGCAVTVTSEVRTTGRVNLVGTVTCDSLLQPAADSAGNPVRLTGGQFSLVAGR
ncbi:MAG: hypothetical protein ACYDAY_09715 [Candidatus Dormibacteria bacterium]